MLPTLFISHGSPMLALRPSPARDFLAGLGGQLPRPKAIVMASGHWETEQPEVSAVAINDTIHDFYGFPPALYAIRYPAPGSPELAERIAGLLREAGLVVEIDHERGLDHGAWVPLSLMYPGHEIPVLQLALQSWLGPPHHLELGRAIAALRAQDVLVIGSGSFTHNLARPRAPEQDAPPPRDIVAFADWMHEALAERRTEDLLDYRRQAPFAALQHPTEEHLLPLFIAMGAAGEDARATRLHASTTWGTLRMDAYSFDGG
jgi:4,5-DOPA dioxygenase extradiol